MGLAEINYNYPNYTRDLYSYGYNNDFFKLLLAYNPFDSFTRQNFYTTSNSSWLTSFSNWSFLPQPKNLDLKFKPFEINFTNTNLFDTQLMGNSVPVLNNTDTFKRTTVLTHKPLNTSFTDQVFSNYDASKGNNLAQTALQNSNGNFTGYCARYVKNAIKEAGLGSYTWGHAYQLAGTLRKNSNFKEIPVNNVNLKDLPAGCILVYDRGVSGYSKQYGHTEITLGDGRAVSDGITKNLRKPSSIFMPISVA